MNILEQIKESALIDELEKIALNALEKRELAKKFGLIFEGTGRNWALRNLRKGKNWEQLGSVSQKHLNAAMPLIKETTPKGVEIGFSTYGTRRSPILRGGIGMTPIGTISNKITRTFHTHPYIGLAKTSPDKLLKDIFLSTLKITGKGNMGKKEIREATKAYVKSSVFKKMVKHMNKDSKRMLEMRPHLMAHPNPENIKGLTDLASMQLTPQAYHNILNSDAMILGIHKIRPKGLREVYRQL